MGWMHVCKNDSTNFDIMLKYLIQNLKLIDGGKSHTHIYIRAYNTYCQTMRDNISIFLMHFFKKKINMKQCLTSLKEYHQRYSLPHISHLYAAPGDIYSKQLQNTHTRNSKAFQTCRRSHLAKHKIENQSHEQSLVRKEKISQTMNFFHRDPNSIPFD